MCVCVCVSVRESFVGPLVRLRANDFFGIRFKNINFSLLDHISSSKMFMTEILMTEMS